LLGTAAVAAFVDGSEAEPAPLAAAAAADVAAAVHSADCSAAFWAAFDFPFLEERGEVGGDFIVGEAGEEWVGVLFAGGADFG